MKNLQRNFTYLFVFSAIAFSLNSCKPEKTVNEENEVITTLVVKVRDAVTDAPVGNFTFKDLDGDKPNLPVQFDTIKLAPSKTYKVDLVLLDETKSPIDTTSKEILALKDDHLFVFKPTPGSGFVTVAITDKDSKNLPVGLESTWTTGTSANGALQIILRHQPDVKNGTESPGDTDLDVTFQVKLQ